MHSPPMPRTERSERIRLRLLEAARTEFLARGYHGASLDRIAGAAGFTKGVVYSRFASKAELFLALLEERIESRAESNRAALAELAEDGDDRLAGLVRRWNGVQRADLAWSLLVLEFRVHAARDPALNRRYAALHDRTLDGIAAIIEGAGVASGADARRLGQAMFQMGNGAVLEQAVDPAAMDDDRAVALAAGLRRTVA